MTLTKKQAWEKIAQAYEQKLVTGKPAAYAIGEDNILEVGAVGLCGAVSTMLYRREIDWATHAQMSGEIWASLLEKGASEGRRGTPSYLDSYYGEDGIATRIVLAQLLAESAED